MSGGHRGDAGGYSSNPNTIPTTIKASSKRKKMRHSSRSKNLVDAFEANGKKPLPIQFDLRVDTYNAVGPNANMFTRYIGNLVACGIPSYYLTWDHVPQEFKTSIVPRLRHFFNLDRSLPEWPLILAGIERECQDCYRNRKRELKRHFDQIGGYHDVGNAQMNPPLKLDHKAWFKTVKLFLDPQYMNRLMKNTETIDPARIDHEAMLAEHAQTPQHGLTLSSSANEARAIINVLEDHCGYDHERVRKLMGSAFSSFSEPPQPPSMPLTYDAMKLFFESINNNMQYLHDLFDTLSRLYPGIYQPPPPPPIIDTEALLASCFPPQQSQWPPQHDDDDYYGDGDDDDDDDYGDDDDDDGDGDGDGDDGNDDDDIYDESDSLDDD